MTNNRQITAEAGVRGASEMARWKGAGLAAAVSGLFALTTALPWVRLSLESLVVLLILNTSALATGKDYAVCFSDRKVGADQLIAAGTPIADDKTAPSRNRVIAYFRRGLAWDDKHDYDRSIADYSEAIMLDARDVSAYFNRGAAWYNKGENDRAIADFNVTISLEPGSGDAYYSRGLAFFRKGKTDAAIIDFEQALTVDPQNHNARNSLGATWQRKGDHDRAITEYDEAIRLDPQGAAVYVNRGIAHASKGDYDLAIADFDHAISLDPESVDAYANRSAAWIGKSDWPRAVADANRAIGLAPDSADGYYNRAVAWTNTGDNDRAIADFDKVIDLNAKDAAAYFGRALALTRKGDRDRATADCRKAMELEPQRSGACNEQVTGGEAPSADASMAAPQQDNSAAIAWNLQRGLNQQIQGYVGGAIDSFSFVIGLDPNNAEAYYDRALARASVGDYVIAAADCRQAIKLDPKRTGTCNEQAADDRVRPVEPVAWEAKDNHKRAEADRKKARTLGAN
ncbi:tetratricopeptide repeat protein [Mesorhizobium sp. M0047]|uniref:tetratricopeptide repeat protein n=1 Tax=Mesorhizobium sp. M0047 TaxID=2956859 RepID=UPI003339F719